MIAPEGYLFQLTIENTAGKEIIGCGYLYKLERMMEDYVETHPYTPTTFTFEVVQDKEPTEGPVVQHQQGYPITS